MIVTIVYVVIVQHLPYRNSIQVVLHSHFHLNHRPYPIFSLIEDDTSQASVEVVIRTCKKTLTVEFVVFTIVLVVDSFSLAAAAECAQAQVLAQLKVMINQNCSRFNFFNSETKNVDDPVRVKIVHDLLPNSRFACYVCAVTDL